MWLDLLQVESMVLGSIKPEFYNVFSDQLIYNISKDFDF